VECYLHMLILLEYKAIVNLIQENLLKGRHIQLKKDKKSSCDGMGKHTEKPDNDQRIE